MPKDKAEEDVEEIKDELEIPILQQAGASEGDGGE